MIKLYQFNRPYIICGLLVLALLLPVSVHPVQGRNEYQDRVDYYVAINGNDANPGTKSSPWRSIQYAVDQVKPGDTIYVRVGTYNESVALNQAGVEGSPITLTAYGAEAVTIDGGAEPAITAKNPRWDGTKYWIIEGFTLDSSAEYTIRLSIWGAFWSDHMAIRDNYIRGSAYISGSYNLFEGNEVDGSQHRGNENGVKETTEVSHHNIYRNNHVHHFNHRGIWSASFTHDSIFEGNLVHDIGIGAEQGQCIDLDGFGTVVWRHIVRNNDIHDCAVVGVALENAFDTVVENNMIHDLPYRGIAIISYGGEIGAGWGTEARCKVGGENNQYGDTDGDNDCRGNITGNIIRQNLLYNIYAQPAQGAIIIWFASGIKILGNTINNMEGGAGVTLWDAEYTSEIEIQGNIIAKSGYGAINMKDSSSITRDSNNLIYQTDQKADYEIDGNRYSLSQYQEMTGKGQGSIAAEAYFIDPTENNFRLLPDSPAIDAGIDIGISTDLDGTNRPQGLGFDLGAYEYGEFQNIIHLPLISKREGK